MTEGTAATFTVTATPAPTAATTVSVAVTEDTSGGQDFVASGNEITHMVSIPASGSPGAGSAMLSIPTVGDNTQEPDGDGEHRQRLHGGQPVLGHGGSER